MSDRETGQGGRGRGPQRDRPDRRRDDGTAGGGRNPSGGPGAPPRGHGRSKGQAGKQGGDRPARPGEKAPAGTKSPSKSVRGAKGRGREIRREAVPALPVGTGNELLYGRNAVLKPCAARATCAASGWPKGCARTTAPGPSQPRRSGVASTSSACRG